MRAYTGQNIIEKQKAPLPSFLSGGQNQNVDERKEYNMTFSEESGIDYQKMHLTPTFFAWILHSFPYFYNTIPDRIFPSFKNDRHVFNAVPYEIFFSFLLTLTLFGGSAGTFLLSGDSLHSLFSISQQLPFNPFFKTHFTSAVILLLLLPLVFICLFLPTVSFSFSFLPDVLFPLLVVR